ncbi:MAG: hypothetical protein GTO51_09120 [Candidatus Latescibacteria bacterium]|nr:hypothetical protein [Candidatus Latescibacterota bacterium]NIM22303.1 hypothetical protein [Candidatus Latescibacterota bacterium]NIM66132.1 hypothetical protein [Candidatus Latescibacterota bacterium]NIO02540.1 hypothetical protein [Candidatus Latescibacterota bacterium]NIO29454.1 hypothetical protein [Candidatus Latescibacterota bacterium]
MMPTRVPNQLEFFFLREDKRDQRRFILTPPLSQHRFCGKLLEKLNYVERFFPELRGTTIKVGLTRAASGMAIPGGTEVWFNPSRVCYHTIAHELVHLLQGSNGIPRGEKSCDVFSLARDWTLNDTLPNYVKIPAAFHDPLGRIPEAKAKLIFAVASGAVAIRAAGLRNYIAFFEKELARLGG